MIKVMKKAVSSAGIGQTSLPGKSSDKPALEPYLKSSTKASGVPLKVEDAGTVAAVVTLVRSATRAK